MHAVFPIYVPCQLPTYRLGRLLCCAVHLGPCQWKGPSSTSGLAAMPQAMQALHGIFTHAQRGALRPSWLAAQRRPHLPPRRHGRVTKRLHRLLRRRAWHRHQRTCRNGQPSTVNRRRPMVSARASCRASGPLGDGEPSRGPVPLSPLRARVLLPLTLARARTCDGGGGGGGGSRPQLAPHAAALSARHGRLHACGGTGVRTCVRCRTTRTAARSPPAGPLGVTQPSCVPPLSPPLPLAGVLYDTAGTRMAASGHERLLQPQRPTVPILVAVATGGRVHRLQARGGGGGGHGGGGGGRGQGGV
jgi:hypothetical protein